MAPTSLHLYLRVKITLNQALRREWERLADEIAEEDPEESHFDLQALRLEALRRSDDYARRKRAEEVQAGLWVC